MVGGPKPRTWGPLTGGAYVDMLNSHYLAQSLSTQPVMFTVTDGKGTVYRVTGTLRNNQQDKTSLSPYDIDSDPQQQQFILYHLLQDLMGKRGKAIAIGPKIYGGGVTLIVVKDLIDVNDYAVIPKP